MDYYVTLKQEFGELIPDDRSLVKVNTIVGMTALRAILNSYRHASSLSKIHQMFEHEDRIVFAMEDAYIGVLLTNMSVFTMKHISAAGELMARFVTRVPFEDYESAVLDLAKVGKMLEEVVDKYVPEHEKGKYLTNERPRLGDTVAETMDMALFGVKAKPTKMRCSLCEEPFEITDYKAGAMVTCPHCGDRYDKHNVI